MHPETPEAMFQIPTDLYGTVQLRVPNRPLSLCFDSLCAFVAVSGLSRVEGLRGVKGFSAGQMGSPGPSLKLILDLPFQPNLGIPALLIRIT